ncbi:MAG TPA: SRPBCC domain-containing protein [Flavobacteriales bacterium]|nr:SRPBCC domain-containing protein [Flavobacteriales bacterium]HMR28235.1 SRPBCC domain-containing protein [Flavobacteriales bacterium]
MNPLITTLMTTTTTGRAKASTTRTTFHRETTVSTVINADEAIIWALLTNAADHPRWNSTVISIQGSIAPGERIVLKSTLDPQRSFKLKVMEFEPARKLVWGDGKGRRTFALKNNGDGTVTFTMHERIGGLLFPMYAKYIPPFDASFEAFAADLKKEAELIQSRSH